MKENKEAKIGKRGRAAVVVLGDIGRSPRMQYHALSLARQACVEVDIVAYGGKLSIILETQWPTIPQSLPKILRPLVLFIKPLLQFLMLLWFHCLKIPTPDVLMVQENRPALIVSSTSWTPDDDFGILLEAAVMYDKCVAAILNENDSDGVRWKDSNNGKQLFYPRLLFVITDAFQGLSQ